VATERVSILVSRDTMELLTDEMDMLINAHEKGETNCPDYDPDVKNPRARRVTVESFLLLLLRQREQHRRRRRKANAVERCRRTTRPTRANVERVVTAEGRGEG